VCGRSVFKTWKEGSGSGVGSPVVGVIVMEETKELAFATEVLKSWVNTAVLAAQPALKESTVLVLPHLSDMVIFHIQEMIKECFPAYVSFVLGPESSKRVVICEEKLLQRKVFQDSQEMVAAEGLISSEITKEETADEGSLSPHPSVDQQVSLQLSEEETPVPLSNETLNPKAGKARRPEKQLYVPVGRRHPRNTQIAGKTKKSTNKSKSLKVCSTGDSLSEEPSILESAQSCSSYEVPQPSSDDHWGVLDKIHLSELADVVGVVQILKPEVEMMDYNILVLLEDPSLGHIVEIYDFPASYGTEDLQKILFEFQDYNIKWINDTSALLLFRNTRAALDVLTLRHPMMKLRPMSIASPAARVKVKRSAEFVLPYKERPVTLPTVARRLISFSLGLRPSKTDYTDEENILRAARERKKLLKAKQDIES